MGGKCGRIASNQVVIDDKALSSEHAEASLLKIDEGYVPMCCVI